MASVNYFDLKSGSFGTSNKLKKRELGVESKIKNLEVKTSYLEWCSTLFLVLYLNPKSFTTKSSSSSRRAHAPTTTHRQSKASKECATTSNI
jgi:hypothetical protein